MQTAMFQFTPLVRGATLCGDRDRTIRCFNSRPSCEGRHFGNILRSIIGVSIHAPRARGDDLVYLPIDKFEFQFTPLVRGATQPLEGLKRQKSFNSRPSCEGRHHSFNSPRCQMFQFTPLVRGATGCTRANEFFNEFQFTPLVRGATANAREMCDIKVSIHAPRARGDRTGRAD